MAVRVSSKPSRHGLAVLRRPVSTEGTPWVLGGSAVLGQDVFVRADGMLAGVPERVVAVQNALAARSRLVIVRRLLTGPATFAVLSGDLRMSAAALREGLTELEEAGFVSDDAPAGRQRKPTSAVFTLDREAFLRDLVELLAYFVV